MTADNIDMEMMGMMSTDSYDWNMESPPLPPGYNYEPWYWKQSKDPEGHLGDGDGAHGMTHAPYQLPSARTNEGD